MKKVIRLTESDLTRIVKRVIKENENEEYLEKIKMLVDAEHFEPALQMAETLGLEEKVIELIIDKIISVSILELMIKTVNIRNSNDPKVNVLISDFIKSNPYLNMVLDRIDPNSRQDKYDEIYSKIFERLYKYSINPPVNIKNKDYNHDREIENECKNLMGEMENIFNDMMSTVEGTSDIKKRRPHYGPDVLQELRDKLGEIMDIALDKDCSNIMELEQKKLKYLYLMGVELGEIEPYK
jgi:hypothetical protein